MGLIRTRCVVVSLNAVAGEFAPLPGGNAIASGWPSLGGGMRNRGLSVQSLIAVGIASAIVVLLDEMVASDL
jgi:hypothetical protein